MNKEEIYKNLLKVVLEEQIKREEQMSKHTSFKVGGSADFYIIVKTIKDIENILNIVQENGIPLTILGNGTNVLISDKGLRGIVLKIMLKDLKLEKEKEKAEIIVGAGVSLAQLAQILLKEGISGFEFASGIPGTIGGAICINAGAYGREIKDCIKKVTYIEKNSKKLITISNRDCNFSYRQSIFLKKSDIIVSAILTLAYGKKEEIKAKMEEYTKNRKEKQPFEFPSAGSTFKRGSDFITSKLIDECGLKGYQIGGAQVSPKHAGFIINKGNATSKDIIELIQYVKKVVLEKKGKQIDLEIKLLGEF